MSSRVAYSLRTLNLYTSTKMHTEGRQPGTVSDLVMASTNPISSPTRVEPKTIGEDEANLRMAIEACNMFQSLIDISYNNIIGLRTQCDVSQPQAQEEIGLLENKIVRHIGQQTIEKMKITNWKEIKQLQCYPSLPKWLKLVGMDEKRIEYLTKHFKNIDGLMEASDDKLREAVLKSFSIEDVSSSDEDDEDSSCQNMNTNSLDDLERDARKYVRGHIKRLVRAQICLHTCVDALQNNIGLPDKVDLKWGSWNLRITKSDESKAAIISAAISESVNNTPVRNSPRPLPPLSSLSRASSRLVNYRMDNNSKSTGSSPLSPPAPPLSAGISSNRSAVSTSSSSSSITPCGFYNQIFDPNHAQPPQSRRPTPPPTPPVVHHKRSFILTSSSIFSNSFMRNSDRKFPTTPPPIRRHQANLFSSEQFPLTKSKSHEEHLSHRIEPVDPAIANKFLKKYNLTLFSGKSKSSSKQHNSLDNLPHSAPHGRRRLATEPGSIGSTSPILSSNCSSPVAVSPDNHIHSERSAVSDTFTGDNSNAPRSPRSQGMLHSIHHRFTTTMKIISNVCNVCEKQMFIGYKCRDCKYYCHWDCMHRAPNSCGLPAQFMQMFMKSALNELENGKGSASPNATPKSLSSASFSHTYRTKSQLSSYNQMNSSHSSSNPSSPALFNQHSSSSSTAISPTNPKCNSQFQFPPDINITYSSALSSEEDTGISSDSNIINDEDSPQKNFSIIHEEEETQKGSLNDNDSKGTSLATVGSGSSGDSVRTLTGRLDSQDSQASDMDQERPWPRQNSLIMREWDIAYDELELEEEIGTGRFGTVFRGNWHGSVAIKRLNMGSNAHEDRKVFETFKQEVATFRKTRHDNLVLFMGACMKPPHLAIVISLCKGLTLHTHVHVRHDKFNLNRIVLISEQICQGIGYLHARGIIHKDLKTKNIFYENGKIIITDFGLSSIAKLCSTNKRGDRLTVPKGWLCYLAPEIIQTLSINSWESDDLPFSFATDVYAYGTILYELLVGTWPFSGQASEVIIWQVGKGIKQPICNILASKEVKDLLTLCWAYDEELRPDFAIGIHTLLQKLPKKRLQRSPSHPAHLQHTTTEQTF